MAHISPFTRGVPSALIIEEAFYHMGSKLAKTSYYRP